MSEPTTQGNGNAGQTLVPVSLLAAVENLREKWSERAGYLENLAGYETDPFALLHKEHAKIIRRCIRELYQAIEATNDRGQARRENQNV